MTQARWLRPVIPAGAVSALLLAVLFFAASLASAQENTVRIEPSGIEVAPGGSFEIAIRDDPPEQSVTAWVLDLRYDPDVLSVGDDACTSTSFPGGMIGIAQCELVDSDEDGSDDSVRVLGLGIFTSTPIGFIEEFTIAEIVFDVVGDPGDCSDLELVLAVHAGADGEETGALVQDGRACIESDAPPSGTATANPVTPRTSAPTVAPSGPFPTPGPGGATQPPGGGTGDGGDDDDDGGATPTRPVVTIDASGRPVTATPPPDETRVPGGTGDSSPGATNDGDGDGAGAVLWVILGLLVLGAAGAGAWWLIRVRGAQGTPPSGGPPPPPASP